MPVFQNQATLYTNDSVIRSNIATGELNDALALTKTAIMDDYVRGDDVTYVISLINSSDSAITGITVTDNLGAYSFGDGDAAVTLYPLEYSEGSVNYYQNGVLQATPSITVTQPLTITGITIPAGGNAMIIYEATANVFADPTIQGTITNTITAASGSISSEASETISAEAKADLTISKFITPETLNEGDEITYTFIIQNHGNTASVSTDGVYVVDTFTPALNITSVQLDTSTFTEYTYTDNIFSTNAGSITVPAATAEQDPTTGAWIITPGVATLTVTGTI